jgi:6-phosphofructokinase
VAAVDALRDGQRSVMVGIQKGEVAYTPHALVASGTKSIDLQIMELAKVLAK